MRRGLGWLIFLAVVVAVGCAGEDWTEDTSAVTDGEGVGMGKGDGFDRCGGPEALECADGYRCLFDAEAPDEPGYCVSVEPEEPAEPTQWSCIEEVRPGYFNRYCLSVDVEWDAQTGACSFQVYLSDKDRESLDCSIETRSLWLESIDCVKWTTVTYDVVSSHRFYENGEENPWASVMVRVTGGVTASGNEFGALFHYMEDPDYLGANFSHDLACEPVVPEP